MGLLLAFRWLQAMKWEGFSWQQGKSSLAKSSALNHQSIRNAAEGKKRSKRSTLLSGKLASRKALAIEQEVLA